MADIIDQNKVTLPSTYSSTLTSHTLKNRGNFNYFDRVTKNFLNHQCRVQQTLQFEKGYVIRCKFKDQILEGESHEFVQVNTQKQQLKIQFCYDKNKKFSTIVTKQKRLNLYRSLMKLEKFSNTQIVINSGNGMIFGGITVKLSKKVDFRYVAKQIALQQSMFIKNIFLVLNLTNQIPSKLIEAKKIFFERLVNSEEQIATKIKRFIFFSTDELKIRENEASEEQLQFRQKKQKIRNIRNPDIIKNSLQVFECEEKEVQNTINYEEVTAEQADSIVQNLTLGTARSQVQGDNKFVFNYCQVEDEKNLKVKETNFKGGSNKILVSRAKMRYKSAFKREAKKIEYIYSPYMVKIIAIKQPINMSEHSLVKVKNQIDILSKFKFGQCPYLTKYYISEQPTFPYSNKVMMDFLYESQSYTRFLNNNSETLSQPLKLLVLTKVAQALYFVHKCGVIHMDLSFGNILVIKNSVRVIDFGQSYHEEVYGPNKQYYPGFTLPFTPPQRFRDKKYTLKYDIYCFMMILYKTFFQAFPFFSSKHVEDLGSLEYEKKIFFSPQACSYSGYEKILNFIERVIIQGLSSNRQIRPFSGWLVIIMKQIFYWFQQYMSFSFITTD